MRINSALSVKRVMLIVLFGLLPWVTTSQTTTQQTALFSDRSTFLSGPRAPSCSGPASNGCDCENSQYRCRDPDRADMCSNDEGGCVTTVEGDPICATGAGKECSSSTDCAVGEACIYVGRISRTLCSSLLQGRQVCATRIV